MSTTPPSKNDRHGQPLFSLIKLPENREDISRPTTIHLPSSASSDNKVEGNNKFLRFVHVSDTHNSFFELQPGDVCVISGDWSNSGTKEELKIFSDYLEKEVAPKFRVALFVAGNHEEQIAGGAVSSVEVNARIKDASKRVQNEEEEHNNSPSSKKSLLHPRIDVDFLSRSFFGNNLPFLTQDDYMNKIGSDTDLLSVSASLDEKATSTTTTTTNNNNNNNNNKCFFALLHDRIVNVGGLCVAGSPWMSMGPWSFPDEKKRFEIYSQLIIHGKLFNWNYSEEKNDEFVDAPRMNNKNDNNAKKNNSAHILISHAPPSTIRDQAGIMPIGCGGLKKALNLAFKEFIIIPQNQNPNDEDIKKNEEIVENKNNNLLLHMFGHAHGQFGISTIKAKELIKMQLTRGKPKEGQAEDVIVDENRSVVFSNGALANHRKDYRGGHVFDVEVET